MVKKSKSSIRLNNKFEEEIPNRDEKILKIGVYLKSSVNSFNKENLPLELQKNTILTYLESKHGLTVLENVVFYIDSDEQQVQLDNLLVDIKNNLINYTIIYKLDYLAKSIETIQGLINRIINNNSRFVCLNERLDSETNTGKFFISILGSIVNIEREQNSKNVQDLFGQFMTEKSFGGATPFGYLYSFNDKDDYIAYTKENADHYNLPPIKVHDKTNDEIYPGTFVKYIFEWFIAYSSISKVAKRLNDLAIPIPRTIQEHVKIYQAKRETGKRIPKFILIKKPGFWSRTTVRDILLNPFYTGIKVWNRFDPKTKRERETTEWFFIDDAHEKIIDEKTYITASALYEEIKKKN